jgi:hypothetical protein
MKIMTKGIPRMNHFTFPMEISTAAVYVWNSEIDQNYKSAFIPDTGSAFQLDSRCVSFRTFAHAETSMVHVHINGETTIDPRALRVIAVPFLIQQGVFITGGVSAQYISVPSGKYMLTFAAIPKPDQQACNLYQFIFQPQKNCAG